MRIGDTSETAVWLNGEETLEQMKHFKGMVKEYFDELGNMKGFYHGPIKWTEKFPGGERVPPVPDHIQGINVRLLVAEADVVAEIPRAARCKFVNDLDKKDLKHLRDVTRKNYAMKHPGVMLTDLECDEIIEEIGPEVAMEEVRRGVDER